MVKNSYPGKFIVIEGLDGSGKSSQIDLLSIFLAKKGKQILATKEPTTDSEAGKEIAAVLAGEIKKDAFQLQKLFAKDRHHHIEKTVIPALAKEKFIVCSRYILSSLAYGVSEGLKWEAIMEINEDFLLPDVTILVDVSPERCMERIAIRGEPQKYFEKLEKLKKVNEFYHKLASMFDNVFVVNGDRSIEEVFESIKRIILMKLGLKR